MADQAVQMQNIQADVVRPRKPIPWNGIFSYTVLIVVMLIMIMPFVWMLSASLMSQPEVSRGEIVPKDPRIENYTDAWDRSNFGQYMWNSSRIALISITGLLIFCIPAAYAFARMQFFGRNTLFAVMLSTLMIPDIVTLIPNYLTVIWFHRFSDAVCGESFNVVLGEAGCAWINNWPALTIPFMASAFTIFLLRQFFAQIPNDLWDAAQLDGAGHLRFMISVVLPLSRAPVMTVVTLAFIGSWNSLLWPLLVTQTDDWRPVAAGLSKFVTSDAPGDFHLQMAASVIMVLPVIVIYFFTQKQFTESIAASGVKG